MAADPLLVALPDKFRGTATADEVCAALGRAAHAAGWRFESRPVSDGGEGFVECFGTCNRTDRVTGPLGEPVVVPWLSDGPRAVFEMAAASGRLLVHGRPDPVRATTAGTGELVAHAIASGATEVLVGAGGSATTDGGLGALERLAALRPLDGSRGYRVSVAVDVDTGFLDAARVFAPQKGASPEQVELLTRRLARLRERYRREYGVDVAAIPGSGAAGGLAGGLAALGAAVLPGFDLVADRLGLATLIASADLVVTGEGRVDDTSFSGKAVGGVLALCRQAGTRAAVICGDAADGVRPPVPSVSLVRRFGRDAALARTAECVELAAAELLTSR